jgi:hypothetical protein
MSEVNPNYNPQDPFGNHFEDNPSSIDSVQDEQSPQYGDPVAICEAKYPITTAAFKKIQQEQYELFCKKQLDYGPENITLGKDTEKSENRKLSLMGLWFRMNDKIQRILNIVSNQAQPNNESLEDSWTDLSNYSIISILVHRNKWGK